MYVVAVRQGHVEDDEAGAYGDAGGDGVLAATGHEHVEAELAQPGQSGRVPLSPSTTSTRGALDDRFTFTSWRMRFRAVGYTVRSRTGRDISMRGHGNGPR
jgi:hypothetical protein